MFEMDRGNPMTRLFYLWVLLLADRGELVPSILEGFPAEVRDTVPARLAFFLAAAMDEGRGDRSLPSVSREIEAAAEASDVFARMLAGGYARAGHTDAAMRWLEAAVARGFINHHFLARVDPFLVSLRGERRFEQLMDVVHERGQQFTVARIDA